MDLILHSHSDSQLQTKSSFGDDMMILIFSIVSFATPLVFGAGGIQQNVGGGQLGGQIINGGGYQQQQLNGGSIAEYQPQQSLGGNQLGQILGGGGYQQQQYGGSGSTAQYGGSGSTAEYQAQQGLGGSQLGQILGGGGYQQQQYSGSGSTAEYQAQPRRKLGKTLIIPEEVPVIQEVRIPVPEPIAEPYIRRVPQYYQVPVGVPFRKRERRQRRDRHRRRTNLIITKVIPQPEPDQGMGGGGLMGGSMGGMDGSMGALGGGMGALSGGMGGKIAGNGGGYQDSSFQGSMGFDSEGLQGYEQNYGGFQQNYDAPQQQLQVTSIQQLPDCGQSIGQSGNCNNAMQYNGDSMPLQQGIHIQRINGGSQINGQYQGLNQGGNLGQIHGGNLGQIQNGNLGQIQNGNLGHNQNGDLGYIQNRNLGQLQNGNLGQIQNGDLGQIGGQGRQVKAQASGLQKLSQNQIEDQSSPSLADILDDSQEDAIRRLLKRRSRKNIRRFFF